MSNFYAPWPICYAAIIQPEKGGRLRICDEFCCPFMYHGELCVYKYKLCTIDVATISGFSLLLVQSWYSREISLIYAVCALFGCTANYYVDVASICNAEHLVLLLTATVFCHLNCLFCIRCALPICSNRCPFRRPLFIYFADSLSIPLN